MKILFNEKLTFMHVYFLTLNINKSKCIYNHFDNFLEFDNHLTRNLYN